MTRPLHILFVCIENSCRSQIAEGFARALSGGRVNAHSAGSRPSGAVHPRAVAYMASRGIDLGSHASKGLEALPTDVCWDYVVTMGCGDACPQVPARRRLDWALEDPKDLDEEGFSRVGAEIERRVLQLVGRAANEAAG